MTWLPDSRRHSSPTRIACGIFASIQWRLFVDDSAPGRYLETFLVGSWEEHQRRHTRETQQDEALLRDLDALLQRGTHRVAQHYLAASPGRNTGVNAANADGAPSPPSERLLDAD